MLPIPSKKKNLFNTLIRKTSYLKDYLLYTNIPQHILLDEEDFLEWLYSFIEKTVNILFDIEAMAMLSKNDTSLEHSLALAKEFGYSLEDINSRLIATLFVKNKCHAEAVELVEELASNNFFITTM